MKAFLLAAGKGERLGSLTEKTPKCVLPVAGKSMLEHWLYVFSSYGVNEVLINLHHLPDEVTKCYGKLVKYGIKVEFVYEKDLLGSAKTIYKNRDFIKDERWFLVAYSDTWMRPNLSALLKFHRRRGGLGTLGLYKPQHMDDQGVVKVEGRKILSMKEKEGGDGQYAFAGLMLGTKGMYKFYEEGMRDLAGDWLPKMVDGFNPYFIDGYVADIGTPERYEEANKKVRGLGLKAL